ncbi:hypothetical protein Y032_0034g2845 [Ancylostoma ceylanicum]|uniref:PAN-3 domain-containing protein n=1 Tax=Ancylostoma ceylanicum TaxID=53326 RepID=A0A016UNW3_9BILA|nr:hypothetical protein Y032_0034g2845 [Ancylostoma ceylanicum]
MNSTDYRVGTYIAVLSVTTVSNCARECYNRLKCSVLMHVEGRYCYLYEKGSEPMFILAAAYELHHLPPVPE